MIYSVVCTPKEGYVAVRRDPATKERDEENRYVFIKKAGNDDLWLVCMRGERAGEALSDSDINGEEWIVMEFEHWDEVIEVYYADFGGFGDNKIGPVNLEVLADEIAERVRFNYENEIEPAIKMQQMTREEFMRQSGIWNSVFDDLRETPEKFVEKFLQKQKDKQ